MAISKKKNKKVKRSFKKKGGSNIGILPNFNNYFNEWPNIIEIDGFVDSNPALSIIKKNYLDIHSQNLLRLIGLFQIILNKIDKVLWYFYNDIDENKSEKDKLIYTQKQFKLAINEAYGDDLNGGPMADIFTAGYSGQELKPIFFHFRLSILFNLMQAINSNDELIGKWAGAQKGYSRTAQRYSELLVAGVELEQFINNDFIEQLIYSLKNKDYKYFTQLLNIADAYYPNSFLGNLWMNLKNITPNFQGNQENEKILSEYLEDGNNTSENFNKVFFKNLAMLLQKDERKLRYVLQNVIVDSNLADWHPTNQEDLVI